jgi:hypothetical protein
MRETSTIDRYRFVAASPDIGLGSFARRSGVARRQLTVQSTGLKHSGAPIQRFG